MNRFDSAFPTGRQRRTGVSWFSALLLTALTAVGLLGSVAANAQTLTLSPVGSTQLCIGQAQLLTATEAGLPANGTYADAMLGYAAPVAPGGGANYLVLGDDDISAQQIAVGAIIPWWGSNLDLGVNGFWVASNGFITFRNDPLETQIAPKNLGAVGGAYNAIYAVNTDLSPQAGGQIWWEVQNAGQWLVVTWDNVPLYNYQNPGVNDGDVADVQLIVHTNASATPGRIEVRVDLISDQDAGAPAAEQQVTIGIEGACQPPANVVGLNQNNPGADINDVMYSWDPAGPPITVTNVSFYQVGNPVALATDGASPYEHNVSVVAPNTTVTRQYYAVMRMSNCVDITSNTVSITWNANPTPVITLSAPGPYCGNTSVNASTPLNAGSTYLWTLSNPAIGGLVTFANTATVNFNNIAAPQTSNLTVTETNAAGCTAASPAVSLTTVQVPGQPTITGPGVNTGAGAPGNPCAGTAGHIYNTTVPFGHIGGSTYYRWVLTGAPAGTTVNGNAVTGGAITIVTTAQNITINWGASTVNTAATLNVTASNGTGGSLGVNGTNRTCVGPTSVNHTLQINGVDPRVVTGPSPVCGGVTGQVYTVPSNGLGGTYTWSAPGGTITSANPTASNSVTIDWANVAVQTIRTVSVTQTTAGGCVVNHTSFNVTVNPTPTPAITGTPDACTYIAGTIQSGQALNEHAYSTAFTSGNVYQWQVLGVSANIFLDGQSIAANNPTSFIAQGAAFTGGAGTTANIPNQITVRFNAAGGATIQVTERNATTNCQATTSIPVNVVASAPIRNLTGPGVGNPAFNAGNPCAGTANNYTLSGVFPNPNTIAITSVTGGSITTAFNPATGVVGITWSAFATAGTITYTETTPAPNQCVTTRQFSVAVNPLPQFSMTPASLDICEGTGNAVYNITAVPGTFAAGFTTTGAPLGISAPSGNFASGGTIATFNSGTGIGTMTVLNPSSTDDNCATATIDYTLSNPSATTCVTTQSRPITVRPTPVVSAVTPSAAAVCAGQTVNVTVTTLPAPAGCGAPPTISYSLSLIAAPAGTPSFSATNGTGVFNGITLGSLVVGAGGTATFQAQVLHTYSNGVCISATSNANVTVNPLPNTPAIVAAPAAPYCLTGAFPTFTITPAQANVHYQWTPDPSLNIGGGNGVAVGSLVDADPVTSAVTVTGWASGNRSISILAEFDVTGCQRTTTYNFFVAPLPNPVLGGPLNACTNYPVANPAYNAAQTDYKYTLTSGPTVGYAYNWTVTNGTIVGYVHNGVNNGGNFGTTEYGTSINTTWTGPAGAENVPYVWVRWFGPTPGVVKVTEIHPAGCATTTLPPNDRTVTLEALPTATASVAASPICVNSPATINVAGATNGVGYNLHISNVSAAGPWSPSIATSNGVAGAASFNVPSGPLTNMPVPGTYYFRILENDACPAYLSTIVTVVVVKNPDTLAIAPVLDTICANTPIPVTVGTVIKPSEVTVNYQLQRATAIGGPYANVPGAVSLGTGAPLTLTDNTNPPGAAAPAGIHYFYRVIATSTIAPFCTTTIGTSEYKVVTPCVPVFAATPAAPNPNKVNPTQACVYNGLEEHLVTYKLNLAATPCFAATGSTLTWAVGAGVGSTVTGAVRSQASDSIVVEWYTTGGTQVGAVTATFTMPATWGGCVASTTFNTTIYPIPQPVITTGPSNVCAGQTGVVYAATAQPGDIYAWEVVGGTIVGGIGAGTSANPSTRTNVPPAVNPHVITIDWLNVANPSATIKLTQISPAGCLNFTIRTITVNPTPTPVVNGPATVCRNEVYTYSTQNNAPNATYVWTVSAGATVLSGANTSAVTVLAGAGANFTISVTETYVSTGCVATSAVRVINLVDKPNPTITRVSPLPGGVGSACLNATVTYGQTETTAGPFNQLWTVSAGGTIVGSNSGSTVAVNWTAVGTNSITLTKWVMSSQCTTVVTQNVVVEPAPAPVISGPTAVCGSTPAVYSTPLVAGHTYAWTSSGSTTWLSPQNTNVVTVQFNNPAPPTNSYLVTMQVTQTATNAGCSNTATLNVTVWRQPTLLSFSRMPTGSLNQACLADQITYTVPTVAGATYVWNVVGGNILSGQGTGSVLIEWTLVGNGSVSVTETNGPCTFTSVLNVAVEAKPTPLIAGATIACINKIHTYSTPQIAGNTYSWSITPDPLAPALPVFAPIAGWPNTSSITLQWIQKGLHTMSVTESTLSGNCVTTYTMQVRVNPIPNPVINSTTGYGTPVSQRPGRVCENSWHTYTVPGTIDNIGNVYFWTVTGGTILSGQNTPSIKVAWGSAGAGTVAVTETIPGSDCSTTRTENIDKRPKPTPVITGQVNPCALSTQQYTTPNVVGNVYTWTVTGGGVILSGNGSNTITVAWPDVPSNTSATVTVEEFVGGTVQAVPDPQDCRTTTSLPVTIRPLPPTITITGPGSVCAVDLSDTPPTNPNGYAYTSNNPGGVSFQWSVSANGSIVSGGSLQTVIVHWFNNTNVATTGTLTLTQTTVFGCQRTASINVTINPIPNPTISGPTSACQNSIQSYSTPGVPGNSYVWSVTGGNIIRSGQNTPNVTVEWTLPGTYQLEVLETIIGGCSAINRINVTVNALPQVAISASGPTTFCQGGDVTLSAPIGFASYNWNTGETSRSIVVRTTGQYWVIVTDANGCSNQSEAIQVNVFPSALPIIATSGPTTFCEGETVTLTGPAGFNAYRWYRNDEMLTETNQSIVVTQSGSYKVAVADNNGCTGLSTEVDVFVNPKPTPVLTVVGSTTVCDGDTVEVRAPAGYETYTWYSSTGQNYGTGRSALVTSGDTIYVQVVDANGCVGTSDTVEIVLSTVATPVLTANGPTTFCEGGAVTLTAPAGYASYLWSNGATGRTITVADGGTYTVTVSNNALCESQSAPIGVTVNPIPARPQIERFGDTLKAISVVAEQYQWYRNGTMIPGAVNRNLVVSLPGAYRVEIADNNTCTSLSQPFDVILTDVADEPVAGHTNDLRVFPNPTNGMFTLETVTNTPGAVRIELVNNLGETVLTQNEVTNGGQFRATVTMGDLATGVYNVVMTVGNERWTVRLVRQ